MFFQLNLSAATYHINKLDHLDAAKIKFTIRQETDLDTPILIENTVELLIESGYKVIKTTDSMIKFDDTGNNNWGRQKNFKMIEEGQFNILTSENGTTIQLTYYIDAFFYALLFPFFLLAGIFVNPVIFFMSSPLLIQFPIQIYKIKRVANNILLDII